MFEKYSRVFRITGIILAYAITFAGLITLPFIFALPRSWCLGLFLVISMIPVFPTIQVLLFGQRPASPIMFAKIYVAEFASLMMQLLFLLATAPFVATAVAGVIPIMMLVIAVIMWLFIGLQQLGIEIGSKMSAKDFEILFWITLGSALLTGIYFLLHKLAKKYGEHYFELWTKGFRKVRDFYRY